jgi:hypothetical protein
MTKVQTPHTTEDYVFIVYGFWRIFEYAHVTVCARGGTELFDQYSHEFTSSPERDVFCGVISTCALEVLTLGFTPHSSSHFVLGKDADLFVGGRVHFSTVDVR